MFRLVLTYQLVLMLLVGPMLCCCTSARLGHESKSMTPATAGKSQRRGCCGEIPTTNDAPKTPAERPGTPGKCPCKDGAKTVAVAPEASLVSTAALHLLASLDLFAILPTRDDAPLSVAPSPRFDHRSSTLSASDILYAHHNLRC